MSRHRAGRCLCRYRAKPYRPHLSSERVCLYGSECERPDVPAQRRANFTQSCGISEWVSVSLWSYQKGPTHRRMHNHREHGEAPVFAAAHAGDESLRGEIEKTLSQTRRKQRHRCARGPLWRGRGSTERGAPKLGIRTTLIREAIHIFRRAFLLQRPPKPSRLTVQGRRWADSFSTCKTASKDKALFLCKSMSM